VENTIGRLRRMLPRKTDLETISPAASNTSFSASTTPHANAWTSRHPPRHSPNSNQSLHFKRDSIYPPLRV
jgi:hypothetical protein